MHLQDLWAGETLEGAGADPPATRPVTRAARATISPLLTTGDEGQRRWFRKQSTSILDQVAWDVDSVPLSLETARCTVRSLSVWTASARIATAHTYPATLQRHRRNYLYARVAARSGWTV